MVILKCAWFLWIALMPCWACIIGYVVLRLEEVLYGQE